MNSLGGKLYNRMIFLCFLFVFVFTNSLSVFAGPSLTTYQAKIIKPDGNPLEANNVTFKFSILNPAASCTVYSELYSSVNMTGSQGLISFSLGSGVRTYPTSGTVTFEKVFANSTPSLACDTGGPPTYSPGANDVRKIVMQFFDGTAWQTLPAMSINAVPYAMYASDSQKLNGKADTDFVEVANIPTCLTNQALFFNGMTFSCVTTQSVSATAVITALGYTPANAASLTTVTSTVGLVSSTVAAVSSSLTSLQNTVAASFAAISASSGLTSLNGSTSSTQTFANGVAGTAPLFNTSNGVHTLNIPLASAGAVTAGLISNFDYLNFAGKITSSSASIAQVLGYMPVSATTLTNYVLRSNDLSDLASATVARSNLGLGNLATLNSVDLGSTNATGILSEARLPSFAGVTSGTQYTKVTVDGKGRVVSAVQLSAIDVTTALGFTPTSAAATGITSLNGSTSATQTFATGAAGTAPQFNTALGLHTLNIPLASAASVTAGLISNFDYLNFAGKITSSAASIAEVLGYTPAASGSAGVGALLAANNLSDVASSTVARNNLGLGQLALLNSLDLSSSFASGTLSVARLPAFIGDATIAAASNTIVLSNTGVTAGTYTKLTVDDKGRVTSSSALAAIDVTTALGFTPVSAAAASQWVTSGTTINYMTGNVGIGTTNPTSKLTVTGDGFFNGNLHSSYSNPTPYSSPFATWLPDSGGTLSARNTSNTDGAATTLNLRVSNLNTNTQNAWITAFSTSGTTSWSPTIAFGQQTSSGGSAERMRIDPSGNVGIGTTAPGNILHVYGSSNTIVGPIIENGTSGSVAQAGIQFKSTGSQYATMSLSSPGTTTTGAGMANGLMIRSPFSNGINIAASDALGRIRFYTGDDVAANERMRIDAAGNVGIGTTTPTAKLQLSAGTSTVASFKLTSGTLLSSPASGSVEYDGFDFYFTDGTNTRRSLASYASAGSSSTSLITNTSGNITLSPLSSVIVSSTTASTNSQTGALIVSGGVGVAGNIFASGTIITSSNIRGASITASSGVSTTVITGVPYLALNPSGGNVGVGTTNPIGRFQVAGGNTGIVNTTTDFSFPTSGSMIVMATGANTGTTYSFISAYGPMGSLTPQSLALNPTGGNVGIGTVSPTATLTVSGTGVTSATASMHVLNGASSTLMYVRNDGNVGIGTTAPTSLLDIASNSNGIVGSNITNSNGGSSARTRILLTNDEASSGLMLMSSTYAGIPGALMLSTGAARPLIFATNGTNERMRVDNSGNVGIGTSSPTSRLEVNGSSGWPGTSGSGSSGSFRVGVPTGTSNVVLDFGTVAGGSTWLQATNRADLSQNYILALNPNGGSVGIGTTNPSWKLEVSDNTTQTARFVNTNGGQSPTGGAGILGIANPGAAMANGNRLGFFLLGGTTNGSSATATPVGMTAFATELWTTGSNGARLALETTDNGSTSRTEKMTILGNGNVGIGTTTPSARLQLASGTSTLASFKFTSGTLLSSPASGSVEYDGFDFYFTDGTNTRRSLASYSSAGSSSTSLITNTSGNITLSPLSSVIVSSTTASTNSQTGALIVSGGVGVAGNIFASGTIITSSNLQGSSITATSGVSTTLITGLPYLALNPFAGNVGVGTTTPKSKFEVSGIDTSTASTTRVLNQNSLTVAPSANQPLGSVVIATQNYVTIDTSNTKDIGGVTGGYTVVDNSSSSGTAINLTGVENGSYNLSSNVGSISGSYSWAQSDGGVVSNITGGSIETYVKGGSVTDVTGLYLFQDNGGGSITNRYGIYIDAPTGTATNDYAFFSAGLQKSYFAGSIGIGTTAPTARLQLAAGTSTLASLKLTSGTLLTSPAAGSVEYDGFDFYFTNGTNTRRSLASYSSGGSSNTSLVSNTSGSITLSPLNSVIVSSTVASTNSQTGALIVSGGVGVAGNIFASGTIITSSNIQGASITATNGVSTTVITGVPFLALNPYGGNVGIGTTAPANTLDVATPNAIRVGSLIGGSASGGLVTYRRPIDGGPNGKTGYFSTGTAAIFGLQENSGNGEIRIDAAGNSGGFFSVYTNPSGLGSSEALRVASSGNVGIGTSATSARLTVTGSGTTAATASLHIINGASSSLLYVRNDGNVGIGMVNPNYKLAVNGDASFDQQLRFTTVGTATATNLASPGSAQSGLFFPAAHVTAFSTNGAESMRIASTGNVGISTSAPSFALDVSGTIRGNNLITPQVNASASAVQIGVGDTNTGLYRPAGNQIAFAIAGVERMRVDAVGNLGIGVTTPSAKLHLASGTSTLASLRLTSGTLLTSPASGSVEYDGFDFYFTDGTNTRRSLTSYAGAGSSNTSLISNVSGNITLSPLSSVIVSSTVASTSSDTGALTVSGGVGVAGNIFASGTIITSSNIRGASITALSGVSTTVITGVPTLALNPFGGNVGIGIMSPTEELMINATDTEIRMRDSDNGSGSNSVTGNLRSVGSDNATLWRIGDSSSSNNDLTLEARNSINFITNSVSNTASNLFISSLGNVSIGTSSTSARLTVSGTGATSATASMHVLNGASASLMYIRNDGNIGIGTTAPSANLEVSGAARTLTTLPTSGGLIFTSRSGDIQDAVTQSFTVNDRFNFNFFGTSAVDAVNNDVTTGNLNTVYIQGAPSGGWNNSVGTASSLFIDSNNLPVGVSNSYGLYVNANSGAAFNFAAYFGGGNVGIGQAFPTSKLSIRSNGSSLSSSSLNVSNTSGTTVLFVRDDGNIGIGTATPAYPLDVVGNVRATSFIMTSDRRAKTNIQTLDRQSSLRKICSVNPVSFDWRNDGTHDEGVIAQELKDIFPEMVLMNPDGSYSVKYNSLIAPMISSIQQLNKKVETLEDKNQKLEERLQILENKMNQLLNK